MNKGFRPLSAILELDIFKILVIFVDFFVDFGRIFWYFWGDSLGIFGGFLGGFFGSSLGFFGSSIGILLGILWKFYRNSLETLAILLEFFGIFLEILEEFLRNS